jgi:hypothetical protein
MDPELALADVVRRWTNDVLPGNVDAADRAVAIALRCFVGGASVAEACEAARRFVGSLARHPSGRRRSTATERLAS